MTALLSAWDVAFLATWFVLPVALLVVGHRRLLAAGSRALGPWSVVAAAAGFGCIAGSLLPSTSAVAERTFAGHMAQHLAVGLVGPLLLVVGRTHELLPWAFRIDARRRLHRALRPLVRGSRSVVGPTLAMVGTWYLWHVPVAYGAAIDVPAVHVLEHTTLLAAAVWFWAATARRRAGASVAALFVATVAMGFLGATLSLAPVAFYADHVSAATDAAKLDDQHLGGLLMWTPGGLVFLLAAVAQLLRWLGLDRDAPTVLRAPEMQA